MAWSWCARCGKAVETWRESYVEDGLRHISIMCAECNAVLLKWNKAIPSTNG